MLLDKSFSLEKQLNLRREVKKSQSDEIIYIASIKAFLSNYQNKSTKTLVLRMEGTHQAENIRDKVSG